MKAKKTGAKALAFALALGMVSVSGFGISKAYAAKPTTGFDGVSGIVSVKPTGNEKYVWGVAKPLKKAPKKPKHTEKKLKDTWYDIKELEEVSGGEVDVYAVSKGKAVKIVVIKADKADGKEIADDDFSLVDIAEGDKGFKVVYSADGKGIKVMDAVGSEAYGYLAFFKTEGKKSTQFKPTGDDAKKIQVKKGKNGKWADMETYFAGGDYAHDEGVARIPVLVQNGADLNFRLEADNAWVSKVSKVKVPKQADGPKVTVDVVKGTVNLKKGSKYLVKIEDKNSAAPALSELTKEVQDAKKNDFKTFGIKDVINGDENKEQNLYVATGAKGKKIASKITKIEIERQKAPEVLDSLEADSKASGKKVKDQGSAFVKDNKVSIELETKYDPTKGAVVKNKSTDTDYEFYVSNKGTDPKADTKWIPLKRAKEENAPTTVKVKYSKEEKANTYVDASSKIFLRKAGKKQEDNNVVIASVPLGVELAFTKIAQNVTVKKTGDDQVTNATFNAKVTKDTTEYDFEVTIANIQKSGVAPKITDIKTTKISKVAIKAEKVDESGKTVVNLKLPKDAFAKEFEQKVEFKLKIEGVDQAFVITFKDASAGAGGVGA